MSTGAPESLTLPGTAGGEGGSNRPGPWPLTSRENTWPGSWPLVPTPDAWAASPVTSGTPVPGGEWASSPGSSQSFPPAAGAAPLPAGLWGVMGGVLGGLSFLGADVTQRIQGRYLGSCFEYSPQATLMQGSLRPDLRVTRGKRAQALRVTRRKGHRPSGSHGGKGHRPSGSHGGKGTGVYPGHVLLECTRRGSVGNLPQHTQRAVGTPGLWPLSELVRKLVSPRLGSTGITHCCPTGSCCNLRWPPPALPATSTLFTTPLP